MNPLIPPLVEIPSLQELRDTAERLWPKKADLNPMTARESATLDIVCSLVWNARQEAILVNSDSIARKAPTTEREFVERVAPRLYAAGTVSPKTAVSGAVGLWGAIESFYRDKEISWEELDVSMEDLRVGDAKK